MHVMLTGLGSVQDLLEATREIWSIVQIGNEDAFEQTYTLLPGRVEVLIRGVVGVAGAQDPEAKDFTESCGRHGIHLSVSSHRRHEVHERVKQLGFGLAEGLKSLRIGARLDATHACHSRGKLRPSSLGTRGCRFLQRRVEMTQTLYIQRVSHEVNQA